MENNTFQTSFIPKKLITSESRDKEPKSFFSMITLFLFISSLLISGGLYVYKTYLTKQQSSLSSSLSITRNSFEKETIDELELFDRRTESAKQILSNHIVLSPMFAILGEITIPSIQYTTFEQSTNDKGFLVNIEGVARDYRSIALQADMFNSAKGLSFKNVLFSDLTKDKNNNVSFNLKFNVDPSLLSYEKNNLQVAPKKINPTTIPTTSGPEVVAPVDTTTTETPLSNNVGTQAQ